MIKKDKQSIKSIGNRIKIAREEIGLSQSDVSRIMNLSRTTCGQWERGFTNPSVIQLVKLADILKTSIEYLARGEGCNKQHQTPIKEQDQEKIVNAQIVEICKKMPLEKKQKLVEFLKQ